MLMPAIGFHILTYNYTWTIENDYYVYVLELQTIYNFYLLSAGMNLIMIICIVSCALFYGGHVAQSRFLQIVVVNYYLTIVNRFIFFLSR
jgi:hypothetical protein